SDPPLRTLGARTFGSPTFVWVTRHVLDWPSGRACLGQEVQPLFSGLRRYPSLATNHRCFKITARNGAVAVAEALSGDCRKFQPAIHQFVVHAAPFSQPRRLVATWVQALLVARWKGDNLLGH